MDAFISVPSPASPGASAQATASGNAPNATPNAGTAGGGLSFGGIFNSLQPEVGRQEVAAHLFAGAGLPALVSQPLGEGLAVITPEGPTPGQDSLLAFARSQGLDDSAIAALWQQPAAATLTPSASVSPSAIPTALPTLSGPGTLPARMPDGLTSEGLQALLGSASGGPSAALPTLPPLTAGAAAAANAKPAEQAAVTVLAMSIQPAALGLQAQPEGEPPAPPPPEINPLAAALVRGNSPRQALTAPPPAPVLLTEMDKPSHPPAPPQVLDLAQDLADIVGQAERETQAAEAHSAPGPSEGAPLPGSVHAEAARANPAQRAAGESAAPQAVISGYQLKAEHYQQLADRMGQALAQRLQQQIERGQWSMQLRLNPGELGQIDVQLDMRQNGLDARFQTENPVTKDLILMGSGRLKEGLQQHGMTIASVHVSSDGERQSNGNPTPQHEQQRRPHAPQEAKAPSEPLREANATKKSGANGLDMMA